MLKSGQQGRESLFHLDLGSGRNPGHRAPVKRPIKSQDLKSRLSVGERSGAFIAEFSGQFDRGFIGLRAAVREKDLPWYAHNFDEPAGQLALRPRIVEVGS